MTWIQRRPWAVLAVCLLIAAGAVLGLAASMRSAVDPTPRTLGEAGSVTTARLTIVPPAVAPLPTTEPPGVYTPAEMRYLQLLHEQTEFEAEYASDASMVLIGAGMCARVEAGETVPQLIDYLDQRGYTSLAAGWIVGSALQELCVPGGDR